MVPSSELKSSSLRLLQPSPFLALGAWNGVIIPHFLSGPLDTKSHSMLPADLNMPVLFASFYAKSRGQKARLWLTARGGLESGESRRPQYPPKRPKARKAETQENPYPK